VIISNHLWEKTLINRSVDKNKITVILNYPDMDIFYRRRITKRDDTFKLMYPGTLNEHQGVDIAIKAFSLIKDIIPSARFYIYGRGPEKKNLQRLIENLELQERVILNDPKHIKEIADIMATADLGIVPKRRTTFGDEAFSTKILEFMSLGVPVIVSDTKIDRYYFDDDNVRFFKSFNIEDLSKQIHTLYINVKLRKSIIKNATQYISFNNWEKKKHIYLDLLKNL
jgi:glycosyltransferase involved in cell wall biosynthesis